MAVDEGILVVGDTLNQEAIMADNQKCSRPRIQKVFQDGQHIRVQIVAWLVQYQHVWLFQKNAQERQASTLATGEVLQAIGKLSAVKAQAFKQLCRTLHLAVYQVAGLVLAQKLKYRPGLFSGKRINLLRKPSKFDRLSYLHQTRGWL